METGDYFIAWSIYLVAAFAFALLGWRFLRRYVWTDLAVLLEGVLLSLLFIPWYVFPDQDFMAPAFIIFLMDSITMTPMEGVRALIPLIMGFFLALLVTLLFSIIRRLVRRRTARR